MVDYSRRLLIVALSVLSVGGSVPVNSQVALASPDDLQLSAALKEVQSTLPRGFSIIQTTERSIPDGWDTRDGGGILVTCESGTSSLRVWIVPPDWIGIQRRMRFGAWPTYDVHLGSASKAIIVADRADLLRDVAERFNRRADTTHLRGHLYATAIFHAPIAAIERRTATLIAETCTTEGERDCAVASLLALHVPVPSIFRARALEGRGSVARDCAFALVDFPGEESVSVLQRVVASAKTDDQC